jgi:hypothetical protein
MKVRIGPYTNWFGPYQLAEKLCFWVKPVKDEYGYKSKPEWVHSFGELLAHGSVRPERAIGEETDMFDEGRKTTLLYRFLSWIEGKKKRKIYVHIDRWDTWSMNGTLGYIIRPMLIQLKESKHGSPFVDDEDVPEHLRSTTASERTQEEKDNGHVDGNHHARWDWVLDEMIFAFESLDGGPNQDWEEQFKTGEYDFRFKKISEDGTSMMVHGPNHTAETDWESMKAYSNRIQKGFQLFGKYYQSLWD